ncbi:MAG: conjugal transfer protein TraX [Alphaproteobacteria bacterium]|nr:conjugal transfer protein TraX [Alphaproteobacteria bacterium]
MNEQTSPRRLPLNLTSYDLLKALAVIIMLSDHVGYYLFLDEPWFRAIGRIGFPVWFFLVGYARGRDFSLSLFVGAAILVAANVVCGLSIFPLNALVTIILIRLLLDPVMAFATRGLLPMLLTVIVVTGLIVPSFSVSEYGTLGFLLAMFGYVVRHRPVLAGLHEDAEGVARGFSLYCLILFLLVQQFFFMFEQVPLTFMMCGTSAIIWALLNFRPLEYPRLTQALPMPLVYATRLMGSRTMEIYVLHLLLLKVAGVFTDPERFGWFDWLWYSPTGA